MAVSYGEPSALVLSGCSTAPEWEAQYRATLTADWDALNPAETIQACTTFAAMTGDEVRALLATGAGNDSLFDQVAADLGIEPTAVDYDAALDVAVGIIDERCG